MQPIALLLLLPSCSAPVQEPALPQAVQRELRIHPLGALAAREALTFLVTQHLTLSFQNAGGKVGVSDASQEWADLAARFCQPALDPRQERIQAEGQGYLLAYLQPAQHAWLERFLELQGEPAREWVADIQARIYAAPAGTIAKLGLDGTATLLADAAAIARMEDALASRKAERASSPRLTLLPGRRGELSTTKEVAYVKSFELRVIEPGGVEIADPIVETIAEGLTMSVRALQVEDGLYGLEVESVLAEIERPIPTRKMRLSPLHETEVEIGLPQVRSAKVGATVRLADGGGVLLVSGGLSGGREMAVLLTFRRAAAPAPGAPGAR